MGLFNHILKSSLVEAEAISFVLEEINPLWAITTMKARVLRIIEETHDVKTFVLKPGSGWSGFRAGQHVGVNAVIDGRTVRRRYTVSSREPMLGWGSATFTITVKRVSGGKVSNWLHDDISTGDVIDIEAPAGDFVLPEVAPEKLLLLSAGSGITPVMSMLRSLLMRAFTGNIVFLHYCRSSQDRIFRAELEQLAAQFENLQVIWRYANQENIEGRPALIGEEELELFAPDYRERHTCLCGPAPFMQIVRDHYAASGLEDRLAFEYFAAPKSAGNSDGQGVDASIALSSSQRSVPVKAGQTLLEAMEAAGESPRYGCRMGICHECTCRMTGGSVRNTVSGQITDEAADVQLCISVAESDLEINY